MQFGRVDTLMLLAFFQLDGKTISKMNYLSISSRNSVILRISHIRIFGALGPVIRIIFFISYGWMFGRFHRLCPESNFAWRIV